MSNPNLGVGLSASHPNGGSGVQLLTPGGQRPPTGSKEDPLQKGTFVELPQSGGFSVYALGPRGERFALAMSEDADLLTPDRGEVVLSYAGHSHGGSMFLAYLEPGARIRTYGYKHRSSEVLRLSPTGVLEDLEPADNALLRVLEESEEESPMQAALRAAGLIP